MKVKEVGLYVLIIIVLNFITISTANCQNGTDTLIVQLEEELFSNNGDKIPLFEYLENDHLNYVVDSSVVIRKNQPNPEIVLSILEKIMHNKDVSYLDRIVRIYKLHMDNFWKEWSKIYKDNYYAPKEVVLQYTILAGFENTIKALEIEESNKSPEEIFSLYKRDIEFGIELYNNRNNSCDIMKRYSDVSQLYRDLNPCSLFSGYLKYDYIDPFKDKIESFLIQSMQNCKFNNCSFNEMDVSCVVFTLNEDYLHSIYSKDIINYYLTNYDKLENCNRNVMAYKYASLHYDLTLTQMLINEIVDMDLDSLIRYPYLKYFTNNFSNSNTELLLDKMLDMYGLEKSRSLELFTIIPNEVKHSYFDEQKRLIDTIAKEVLNNEIKN